MEMEMEMGGFSLLIDTYQALEQSFTHPVSTAQPSITLQSSISVQHCPLHRSGFVCLSPPHVTPHGLSQPASQSVCLPVC